MAKSLTVPMPMPTHRRRDSKQMTRKYRFCTALVTAPPPASSHWSGQYCSYHCCCCKLSEVFACPGLWIGTGLRGRDKHPEAPALGTSPTTCTRRHHEASERFSIKGFNRKEFNQPDWASLPPLQRDGERSGEGPFPVVSTFKPKKQAVWTWPIKRAHWETS